MRVLSYKKRYSFQKRNAEGEWKKEKEGEGKRGEEKVNRRVTEEM
jgi:hypothetical protein